MKSIKFVVTKVHEEDGLDLTTQYTITARSKRDAYEQVFEEENISIEEIKSYGTTNNGVDKDSPEDN